MIRRRVDGGLALIRQSEIARVAAGLIEHIGSSFAPSSRPAELAQAVTLQDCGFDALDDRSILGSDGRPMQSAELSMVPLLRAWSQSASAAESTTPYVALLVSILSLQRSAALPTRSRTMRELFELNRMQQQEILRQEQLRPILGLRNDIPMRYGLPDSGTPLTDTETQFTYGYRLMLLAGRIALEACTHQRAYGEVGAFANTPNADSVSVQFRWATPGHLAIHPWPFTTPTLPLRFHGKVIEAKMYDHENELLEAIESATNTQIEASLQNTKPRLDSAFLILNF